MKKFFAMAMCLTLTAYLCGCSGDTKKKVDSTKKVEETKKTEDGKDTTKKVTEETKKTTEETKDKK